jgi:hypothetical protein
MSAIVLFLWVPLYYSSGTALLDSGKTALIASADPHSPSPLKPALQRPLCVELANKLKIICYP